MGFPQGGWQLRLNPDLAGVITPMKACTLANKLQSLGIVPSYSRPRVSDDNAYVESFFRTLKYVPQWPSAGFANLQQRDAVYAAAKAAHPERWSGKTRNWTPVGAVNLNPDRQQLKNRKGAA